jgi:hypothetical protein
MNDLTRTRAATLGLLLLVFGVGVLAGVAGDRLLSGDPVELLAGPPSDSGSDAEGEREDRKASGDSESASGEEGEERRRSAIIHRVDLTEVQRVAVDSLLAYYRSHVRELTDTYNDAYWTAVQQTRDELREILDEEQRIRYDSLLVENDRRRGRIDD